MLHGNSFTDQACLIKMAGYQPRPFFLRFFMDQDFVLEDKNAEKRELGQSPAILTLYLVNNA